MWARLESNTIKEILIRPKALTIGGAQYPSNIFSMWTDSELAAIGIVPITMDYTNRKDFKYYINTEITYTYSTETGKATGSYGTATARAIADTLFTAQDETDGLGTEGEVKDKGLKSREKELRLKEDNQKIENERLIKKDENLILINNDLRNKEKQYSTYQ